MGFMDLYFYKQQSNGCRHNGGFGKNGRAYGKGKNHVFLPILRGRIGKMDGTVSRVQRVEHYGGGDRVKKEDGENSSQ